MDPLGTAFGIGMGILLVLVAGYFIVRQRQTLQTLRWNEDLDAETRRYLQKQSWRRLFGAAMLCVLGAMLFGSVFLDYDPTNRGGEPPADQEAAKQAVRFLSLYMMTMLLILLAIFALAVLDFWAVARHGIYQQKQLLQEHQAALEAELIALRNRQADDDDDD